MKFVVQVTADITIQQVVEAQNADDAVSRVQAVARRLVQANGGTISFTGTGIQYLTIPQEDND